MTDQQASIVWGCMAALLSMAGMPILGAIAAGVAGYALGKADRKR